jgi:protein SCO1/2
MAVLSLPMRNKQVRPPSLSRDFLGQASRASGLARVCRRFLPLIWIIVSLCLVFVQGAVGHAPVSGEPIGIDEKIGQTIPANLTFFDEQGRQTTLGAIMRKPTILVLVYYTCSRFCPQLLAGLATALPQLGLTAAKDYQVMTVSFDASDTPALARDLKRNYLMAIGRPFPENAWRFLTGDRRNIEQLCTAVGFSFRKEHDGFAHPVALIILSPERRITRYIHVTKFAYGVESPITFSPIGLALALADASQGKAGAATGREFLYCFPHEPYRQQGFYHILAAIGAGTIIGLALLFVYLALSGRKPREGKNR